MWSYGGPIAWRYRLYFPMLLLVISVGKDWSVHSILEFSAMKKNLRIKSDMERDFWTVLFQIASLMFMFFTPSVSSFNSRLLRWLMKPKCALYLSSFFCSFFVAQSSLVFIALVYSRDSHTFPLSKASPSGLREMKVSWSPSSK